MQNVLDAILAAVLNESGQEDEEIFHLADVLAAQALCGSGNTHKVSEALIVASMLVHWTSLKEGRSVERSVSVFERTLLSATGCFINGTHSLMHQEAELPDGTKLVGLDITRAGAIGRANGFKPAAIDHEQFLAWAKKVEAEVDRVGKIVKAEQEMKAEASEATTTH